eukprot:g654.t1
MPPRKKLKNNPSATGPPTAACSGFGGNGAVAAAKDLGLGTFSKAAVNRYKRRREKANANRSLGASEVSANRDPKRQKINTSNAVPEAARPARAALEAIRAKKAAGKLFSSSSSSASSSFVVGAALRSSNNAEGNSSSSAGLSASQAATTWTKTDTAKRIPSKEWDLEALKQQLPEKTQEVLGQWFANKRQHWYVETAGEDKQKINIEELASDFAVEGSPVAFSEALASSSQCRHVVLRLEMDATSRETRGRDRRVNRSAKWLASLLSGWFSNHKASPKFWPRFTYLPTPLLNLIPGKDLPDDLTPTERIARIAVEMIWPYLAQLPKGTSVTTIFAGDAAESASITTVLALLDARVRKERPDLIFLPWAVRCTVHQATIAGEEAAGLFCTLTGSDVKIFQNKLCLQVLQKRKQGDKYYKLVTQQAEQSVHAMEDEAERNQRQESVAEYQTFLKDMGCKDAAKNFQGAVPVVEECTTDDGEAAELHSVRAAFENMINKVREGWQKLYQKLREPRFSRWLTFGPAARREAVHESLNSIGNISTRKPWFFTQEEWREFKQNPQLDTRFCIQKLLLGHLFRPLDTVVERILSLAGSSSSTTEISRLADKAFRGGSDTLLDKLRIRSQMRFATMFSKSMTDADKEAMRVDTYIALLAAAASFQWRITSGCRDIHDVLLEEFRAAQIKDDPSKNFTPQSDPYFHRKQAMQKILSYGSAKKKLPNEPGSVCLISIITTLKDLPLLKAIEYFSELSACLVLSPSHQAGVERLIALAKHEQQGCFHNHRGQARLAAAVTRRKTGNAWGVAKVYEAEGSDEEMEMEDESELAGSSLQGGSKSSEIDGEVAFADLVSEADRKLLEMKISPSYYSEYLSAEKRLTPFQGHEAGSKVQLDFEERTGLQAVADERKKRRLQLLEAQAEYNKKQEAARTDAQLRRKRRAKLQLKFFERLRRYVYHKFTLGGKIGGGKNTVEGGWTYKERKADLAERLYTASVPQFLHQPSTDFEVYKFSSSGVERFLGWVVACKLGKKKYHELEKYWDAEERADEWEALKDELGDQDTVKDVFDAPRSVMAIELPELKSAATGATIPAKLLVIFLVERSPFSFVGATAKRVEGSSSQIVVDDTVRSGEGAFMSLQHRPYLRKFNKKQGTLFSVQFKEATKDKIVGELVWKQSIKFPAQTKEEKQQPELQPADAAAIAEADAGEGGHPKGDLVATQFRRNVAREKAAARPKKGMVIVRAVAVEFEDSDEERKQKVDGRKQRMKKQPPKPAAASSSSSKEAAGSAGAAAAKRPAPGGKKGKQSGASDDSEWSDDSEEEAPAMKQYLLYNMNSDAERKAYVRQAQLAMLTAGGCEITGLGTEVVSICQVKVYPFDPDVQFLLQELPKLQQFRFEEWMVMRGRKACRRF